MEAGQKMTTKTKGDTKAAQEKNTNENSNKICASCHQEIEGKPAGFAYVTPFGPQAFALIFGYELCPACWARGKSGNEADETSVAKAVNAFHMTPPPPPKKRLPAYARELAAARHRGLVPKRQGLGHVVVTFEWRQECAPDYPVVVIPEDADPLYQLDWHFTAGLDVFIMHRTTDRERLLRLIRALHQAKAASIKSFDINMVSAREDGGYLNWRPQHAS